MIFENKPDTYQNNIDYNNIGNNISTFKVFLSVYPSIKSTYFQRRANIHDK